MMIESLLGGNLSRHVHMRGISWQRKNKESKETNQMEVHLQYEQLDQHPNIRVKDGEKEMNQMEVNLQYESPLQLDQLLPNS